MATKKTSTTKSSSKSGSTTKSKAQLTREKNERAKRKAEREANLEAQKVLAEKEQEKLRKKKLIQSEIISFFVIALGVFFGLSMFTQTCGNFGIGIKDFLYGIFGLISYIIPFMLILLGVLVFAQKTSLLSFRTTICLILLFVFLSAFAASFCSHIKNIDFGTDSTLPFNTLKDIYRLSKDSAGEAPLKSGGVIGTLVAFYITKWMGKAGLYIVCALGTLVMLLFILDTPISTILDNIKLKREVAKKEKDSKYYKELEEIRAGLEAQKTNTLESTNSGSKEQNSKLSKDTSKPLDFSKFNYDSEPVENYTILKDDNYIPSTTEYEGEDITPNKRQILDYVNGDPFGSTESKKTVDVLEKYSDKSVIEPQMEDDGVFEPESLEALTYTKSDSDYNYPPLSLLKKSSLRGSTKDNNVDFLANILENTLKSFNVDASVVGVVKGPSVTRFEVQPSPGVPVSKIVHLENDIALNLRAKSIRIEAPIPGKAAVGIEVSNETASMVYLRDILESKEFKSSKSKLSVALGKSIGGECIVCDLHDMPHLLVAGTTGSGKSVLLNSMLTSILYHASPDEVKLILIDPKVVELAPFNGIPHLKVPVVTEPNKAATALACEVTEMNERYVLFADAGVRDLQSYNEAMKFNDRPDLCLPEIVIVIDELADLIKSAKNQVEDSIQKLAQKARAAGMHLLIATQRPSTDVITGVIKGNIPSRIALSVSSQIDSRVIIDMGGAENLLGKGDMLYSPQSLSKPIRIQGACITDAELKSVVEYISNKDGSSSYDAEMINAMDKVGSNNMGKATVNQTDELFMDALQYCVESNKCSVAMLQRRFRIGFNRAGSIVDMMEQRGMVGPSEGQQGRKVLMTKEEFDEYVARTEELS